MSLVPGEAQHDPVSGMAGGIWTYFVGLVTALSGLTETQSAGVRKFCEAIAQGVIDEINLHGGGGGGGGGSSFYQTIKNAASSLTQRAFLKFDGTLIQATDDGTNTVVDPSGLVPKTTTVTGTDGCTGGGALSGNQTISLPDVGPGAGTYGGSGSFVESLTLDVKGKVTAGTLATPMNGSLSSGYVPYASGAKVLSDSGVYWDSTNGRLAVGTTSPSTPFDVRVSTNKAAIHIRTGSDSDDGGYLRAGNASSFSLSAGAKGRADGWEARATSANIFEFGSASLDFYANTGLTPGTLYDPTWRFGIAADGTVTVTNKITGLTQATASTDAVAGGRTLTASTGITGGGDLTANRSFAVDQSFSPTWSGTHVFSNIVDMSAGATKYRDGAAAAVSASGTGRVRYNDTTHAFEVSVNGSSYTAIRPASAETLDRCIPLSFQYSYWLTTPKLVSTVYVDPRRFSYAGSTLSAVFQVMGAVGRSGLTGHARLYNLSDAEIVYTLDITGTTTAKWEQTLTLGTSSGNLKNNAGKSYELRIWVDSPLASTDTIEITSASLIMTNTF